MKKGILLLFSLLFVMVLGVSSASAIDMNSGPQAAAAYFPADTKVFAAMRTDEAFVEELETLVSSIRTQLPADVPQMGVRDGLRQAFANSPVDYDTVMTWFGDWGAFGLTTVEENGGQGYFVLALEDQAALQAYMTEHAAEWEFEATEDGFITGNTRISFGDGVVYVTENGYTLPEVTSTLLDSENFQTAVGGLTADQYNVVLYADLNEVMANAEAEQIEAFGLNVEALGHVAVGFTILDGRTLTIDTVQTEVASDAAILSSDFTRFIPSNASAFVQANNLTGLFNTFTSLAQKSAAEQGNPDPMEQVTSGLQALGIDLEEDILSWTTGDFALILRSDIAGGLGAMESAMSDPLQYADFGLVVEATDAAKAQELVTRLNSIITMAAGQNPNATVTTEDINGTEVTIISTPVQPGAPMTVDVAIGANDEVFFVATRAAAEAILSGSDSITGNITYQEASKYFLPNPTTVWYADSNGVAAATIVPLALLGPAIGNIFNEISTELGAPSSSQAEPQMMTVSNENQTVEEIQMVQQLLALLHSGTISSTAGDGVRKVRVTLSLNVK